MQEQEAQKITIGSLLSIRYQQYLGLTLKWSFHGIKLQKHSNIYHCFMYVSHDGKAAFCHNFAERYYGVLNFGDLVCISRKSRKNGEAKKISWIQKSIYTPTLPIEDDEKVVFSQQQIKQTVLAVLHQVSKYNGIILLNIVIHQKQIRKVEALKKEIEKLFKQLRKKICIKGFPIINILHSCQINDCIDTVTGVNSLKITVKSFDKVSDFLNKYSSGIIIGKVDLQMTLQSEDYFIGPSALMILWEPFNLKTYQKLFYCPFAGQFNEIIVFSPNIKQKTLQLNLKFDLAITFIDGSELRCSKKYQLEQSWDKRYSKTVKLKQQYRKSEIHGLPVLTNMKNSVSYINLIIRKSNNQGCCETILWD